MFIETLIAAVAFGCIAGGCVVYAVAIDPIRRTNKVLRDRIIAEQMRTYAANARLSAHKYLRAAEARELDTHSRHVNHLEVVR